MNKAEAKQISEIITNEQLRQMLENAKSGIKDWTQRSKNNKGMTVGAAWNILAKDFDVDKSHHPIAKYNMVREFGEFLPEDLKPKKKEKGELPKPFHQEPNFEGYD